MPEDSKSRRKRKSRKKKEPKRRNPYALIASMRTGAGPHGKGHPGKEQSRNACRGRIDIQNYLEDEEDDDEYMDYE